jgi:hypothetical protein
VITLLTDFGLSDPSVGEMKGAILGIEPDATLVDLTHGVEPGNVREAAWILSRAWRSFPEGTCHLVVVDPGVGTDRRGVAASAGGRLFVAPDNGVLMPTLEMLGGPIEIRELAHRELGVARRGTTFDGRDVFAPAAARLLRYGRLAELGPEVHDPVEMAPFVPRRAEGGWRTEIIRTDRFGNLVTTMEESFLRERGGDAWRDVAVRVGEKRLAGLRLGYGDVEPGALLLSIGGSGTLEISVNRGSARRTLNAAPGDPVFVEIPEDV